MGTILSKAYALRLVKQGKATVETALNPDDNGRVYAAITRHDTQETAHYLARRVK